jgi:hypothetical protein
LAGARERAGLAAEFVSPSRAAPPVEGYGFAPEMIQTKRSCRTFFLFQELPVTAYLISLALAGLLAIAIWECLE